MESASATETKMPSDGTVQGPSAATIGSLTWAPGTVPSPADLGFPFINEWTPEQVQTLHMTRPELLQYIATVKPCDEQLTTTTFVRADAHASAIMSVVENEVLKPLRKSGKTLSEEDIARLQAFYACRFATYEQFIAAVKTGALRVRVQKHAKDPNKSTLAQLIQFYDKDKNQQRLGTVTMFLGYGDKPDQRMWLRSTRPPRKEEGQDNPDGERQFQVSFPDNDLAGLAMVYLFDLLYASNIKLAQQTQPEVANFIAKRHKYIPIKLKPAFGIRFKKSGVPWIYGIRLYPVGTDEAKAVVRRFTPEHKEWKELAPDEQIEVLNAMRKHDAEAESEEEKVMQHLVLRSDLTLKVSDPEQKERKEARLERQQKYQYFMNNNQKEEAAKLRNVLDEEDCTQLFSVDVDVRGKRDTKFMMEGRPGRDFKTLTALKTKIVKGANDKDVEVELPLRGYGIVSLKTTYSTTPSPAYTTNLYCNTWYYVKFPEDDQEIVTSTDLLTNAMSGKESSVGKVLSSLAGIISEEGLASIMSVVSGGGGGAADDEDEGMEDNGGDGVSTVSEGHDAEALAAVQALEAATAGSATEPIKPEAAAAVEAAAPEAASTNGENDDGVSVGSKRSSSSASPSKRQRVENTADTEQPVKAEAVEEAAVAAEAAAEAADKEPQDAADAVDGDGDGDEAMMTGGMDDFE